jgi:hypothetical protein
MDWNKYLLGLVLVVCMASLAIAENTTMDYYCPRVACQNQDFQVWVEYKYNDSAILNADITADTFNLSFNATTNRYEGLFTSGTEEVWNYTIQANSTNVTNENLTGNCATTITACFNLTINIWQQLDERILTNTSHYYVSVKNYNKQLNTPYINDFSWIVAKNLEQNASDAYEYCNVPFGSGQSILGFLDFGSWANQDDTLKNASNWLLGCDQFWFRARYDSGEAILSLPYTGNYSLFLLDGVMTWENGLSPPKITKSNLFFPLGILEIPAKAEYTQDFWISHSELNFWGSFLASSYPLIVTVVALFLFIALIILGLGFRLSTGLTLMWIIIWTIIRML